MYIYLLCCPIAAAATESPSCPCVKHTLSLADRACVKQIKSKQKFMITNYVSKREIFSKKKAVFRRGQAPQLPTLPWPFTPPWRVSMLCAVGVVFTDGLVALHAVKQQSRRYEFHRHHLGERAVVHLAYGHESTRSHNRYHQSFRYCPHNPVFFVGC